MAAALSYFLLILLSFSSLFPAFCHLDGCDGTFVAFVAKHTAAALLGLLECVAGKQAVDDGNLSFAIQVGKTLRDTLADVIEVRCVATNDASDGYDDINEARADEACGAINQLEASGDGFDDDAFLADTMLHERLAGTLKQSPCDFFRSIH